MSRRVLILVLALTLVALGTVVGGPPAQAVGTLHLRGHGWGHGRGLGQYGALGYAVDHSWTSAQILDRYYGGTSASTIGQTAVSVRMQAQDGTNTIVVQEKNQLNVNGAPAPSPAVRIERVSANSFRIYDGAGCNGPWTARAATVGGPVVMTPRAPTESHTDDLQLCESNGVRWLRGSIAAWEGENAQRTVNTVDMEYYLRGVVPRESPASWGDLGGGKGIHALRAQAVAARSYAASENRYGYAKTCNTQSCQVYMGRAEQLGGGAFKNLEDPRTNRAISETAGGVRRHSSGTVARTEFSSSTGGYTAGGTFPAVPDDGDDIASNSNHTWNVDIAASTLEARYNKGSFVSAEVTQRNGLGEDGGRVLRMVLHFSGGDVALTGDEFRIAMGLKSNWFTPTSGLTFTGWEGHGGALASGPGAAAWANGRVDVFAQGPNNTILRRFYDGQWRPFETVGGMTNAAPAVTSQGANKLDLFVRGVDNALWYRPYSSGWGNFVPLGGQLTSAPAAVSWAAGRIDVFARGSDNALWHRYFDGAWQPWRSLGGVLTSAPAVASWSPGRLDVFTRGSDNALWHRLFENGWSEWKPLGGTLAGAPAATGWAPGRLDVYVRGTDNALYHKYYESGWSGYEGRSGVLTADPAVTDWGPGRLDVFVRGGDNGLWHGWET
jgi:SpoIID/LytB domain protein